MLYKDLSELRYNRKDHCLSPALVLLFAAALIGGCAAPSPYTMKKDTGPTQSVSVDHIPDAVPRHEPRTIAGNKSPYKVLGKTYSVLTKPESYREKGTASWYGRKFHGHRTSNGEIYNMYGMTAAHKTLPIPCYVRVTNLNNGKQVIVRVNDRGPFHGDRVIDLTYTAAKKLGFVSQGTAPVVVEYVDPDVYAATVGKQPTAVPSTSMSAAGSAEPMAPAPVHSGGYQIPANTYLQVGAFSLRQSAEALQKQLLSLTSYPVNIQDPAAGGRERFYRVRIGPLKDNFDLLELREKLAEARLPEPHVVYQ